MTPTVNRLQKIAQLEAAFNLRSEAERQALANLIVKAARMLKSPMDFVSYDHLKAGWKAYRAAYWAAHPQRRNPDTDVDWDKHEERCLPCRAAPPADGVSGASMDVPKLPP
jgi:hypothetical protein